MKNNTKGSVIYMVTLSTIIIGIFVAAIISLIATQRRLNIQKELQLKAYSTAESAIDYAYSYIVNDVKKLGNTSLSQLIPKAQYSTLQFNESDLAFLNGTIQAPSGYTNTRTTPRTTQIAITNLAVHIQPLPAPVRHYIDGNDPANANDINKNNWVFDQELPMVARVTLQQGNTTYTAYLQKNVSIRKVSMDQHAIFYSGQLQLHRGFRTLGSIHANGDLILNSPNGDNVVFNGSLSSSGHIYRGATFGTQNSGTASGINAYGYTAVLTDNRGLDFSVPNVVNPYAPVVKLAASGGNTDLKILSSSISNPTTTYTNYNPSYPVTDPVTNTTTNLVFDSRSPNWKTKAIELFNGNLEDVSHSVPVLTPTGSQGYTQDSVSTNASTENINEFNNGPYSLIEPLFPVATDKTLSNPTHNENNLEGKASLILRVEGLSNWTPKDASGNTVTATATNIANYSDQFVVRAYAYKNASYAPDSTTDPVLTQIPLPASVIGAANATITGIQTPGTAEAYNYDTTTKTVTSGLHDSRLGRGVQPITLDMAELKRVLEADISTLSTADQKFREALDTSVDKTPGDPNYRAPLVYVEFPTSVTLNKSVQANELPMTGLTGKSITTYPYQYGSPALLHPDRAASYDNEGRANRTDGIIPIAPQLNQYPPLATLKTTIPDSTLQMRQYAIPALQIINGSQLPNPSGTNVGFSVGTNAPLYLVGNYNSDGKISEADVSNSSPTNYAKADPGEIPAALFSDSLTILSNQWASNRAKSFPGTGGASDNRKATTRVEIGASIATGEYPIFEFFTHALESYQTLYRSSTIINPIVIKGSMIGMFHSEIQHFKQAYGRSYLTDIQTYYTGHGNSAIPSVRYSQFLVDGNSPPGVPTVLTFSAVNFRILRNTIPDDAITIKNAGF